MLSNEIQENPVLRAKLEEIVCNNDRALSMAAARMNVDLTRSLKISRVLTAIALTVCAMVLFVVRHQGRTIAMQQRVNRQIFRDNQELFQYRLNNPPAAHPSLEPQTEKAPSTAPNPSVSAIFRA
ncbi:MAG: hypothetical protein JO041_00105 [Acidobacteria bacterium]|nr:hypothetical protein [Acidobacteriota bacterium]